MPTNMDQLLCKIFFQFFPILFQNFQFFVVNRPIDDTDALKLSVEKCFSLLGFTKAENIKKQYFMGTGTNQILPDPSGGEEGEEAFISMVHAMRDSNVYGLVRKVYNCRSSPQIGCLIPEINEHDGSVCLIHIALPFEDDLRKFTLENFTSMKKWQPNEKQLNLVDQLIDTMDLTINDDDDDEEESEELYDPKTTFNPYIQRMFQSIASRATNPNQELPDFENHITTHHLTRIGSKVNNATAKDLIKRCADQFELKVKDVKKVKDDKENIFIRDNDQQQQQQQTVQKDDNQNLNNNFSLDSLLIDAANSEIKTKKIGTATPVSDFKFLAEKLFNNNNNNIDNIDIFEGLCEQIQIIINDLIDESFYHMEENVLLRSFQEKAFDCIRAQRQICLKFKQNDIFNEFLKSFKSRLIDKTKANSAVKNVIKTFWNEFFIKENMTLISAVPDDEIGLKFLQHFIDNDNDDNKENQQKLENNDDEVEDLLDLM
jgi:hypothetical protein